MFIVHPHFHSFWRLFYFSTTSTLLLLLHRKNENEALDTSLDTYMRTKPTRWNVGVFDGCRTNSTVYARIDWLDEPEFVFGFDQWSIPESLPNRPHVSYAIFHATFDGRWIGGNLTTTPLVPKHGSGMVDQAVTCCHGKITMGSLLSRWLLGVLLLIWGYYNLIC